MQFLERLEEWSAARSPERMDLLVIGGSAATGEFNWGDGRAGSDLDLFLWCPRRHLRALTQELDDLLHPIAVHVCWVGPHGGHPLQPNFGSALATESGIVLPRGRQLPAGTGVSATAIPDHEAQRLLWNRLCPFLIESARSAPSISTVQRLSADLGTLLLRELGVFESGYAKRYERMTAGRSELTRYSEHLRSVAERGLRSRIDDLTKVPDATAVANAVAEFIELSPQMKSTSQMGVRAFLKGWLRILLRAKYWRVLRHWRSFAFRVQDVRTLAVANVLMCAARPRHQSLETVTGLFGITYWICESGDE